MDILDFYGRNKMTEEYLYKACASCGKGTKGKDIVHTWDCPNNPRNIEEKPMTYEQAREKVAKKEYSEAELKALENGGELVVTDPDQRPSGSPYEHDSDQDIGWAKAVETMLFDDIFRKVVTQQSEAPRSEDEMFARGI